MSWAGSKPPPAVAGLKIITAARANNIAIMLTRFSQLKGAASLERALLDGSAFTTEQLGLLLQVGYLQCIRSCRLWTKMLHGAA